jgi:quinol monooxygenase YgiN
MVIVTAKIKLQKGASEQFLDAYRWMKPQVMRDPGAILYALQRSAEDPDVFLFYERYESEEAFAYHLSTEHFKTLSGRIDPLMAEPPEIGKWVEIA